MPYCKNCHVFLGPNEKVCYKCGRPVSGVSSEHTPPGYTSNIPPANPDEAEEFFGPVISEYGVEQAIEDGVLVDFATLGKPICELAPIRIVASSHLADTINAHQMAHLIVRTLNNIKPGKPDMLVFRKGVKMHTEDEGRTLFLPFESDKSIYAKLDGRIITFMFPEDY